MRLYEGFKKGLGFEAGIGARVTGFKSRRNELDSNIGKRGRQQDKAKINPNNYKKQPMAQRDNKA